MPTDPVDDRSSPPAPGDDRPTEGDRADPPAADPREDAVALAHQLLDLARDGDQSLLAWVDEGVPVNLTDPDGNTLVMLAAYHGHAALAEALVDRGADVDRCNDRGQSPLAGAVFKGAGGVVEVLVAAGADPDLGEPSARAAAAFFDRPDLAAHFPDPPTA